MNSNKRKKEAIQTVFQELEAVTQEKTAPLALRASLAGSPIIAFLNVVLDDLPEDIHSRVTHAIALYIKLVRNQQKRKLTPHPK